MNALKTVVQKWKDMNAILRILIGLVIGLALGLLFPNMPVIGLLGSIFVGSLKGSSRTCRSSACSAPSSSGP